MLINISSVNGVLMRIKEKYIQVFYKKMSFVQYSNFLAF